MTMEHPSTPEEKTGPMVSVIIPVYNASYCIDRCLENLFRSDYTNFEALVVDDGSSDDTLQRVRAYRCQVIRQPYNQGAAAARNRGGREARGEILFFLDADVFIRNDTIRIIVEDLAEKGLADAVIGVYTRTQETRGFYSQYQNLFTVFNHEKSKGFIGWFWTAMGAVKKAAFERAGGFNEKYSGASAEDVELGYTLCEKGYRILYDNRIEGVHLHHHTLKSLLVNNFKKSAALVELVWKMSKGDKFAHGFSDKRNLYALFMAFLITISAILIVHDIRWLFLLGAGAVGFVLANLPFYRFLRGEKGNGFLLKTISLHYLIYVTVGVGSFLGTVRYYLHRLGAQPKRSWEESG
jgi:glycosyltransferase involved in cell wall biosynthesis